MSSTLSQNPAQPKFERSTDERRQQNSGNPDGEERRKSLQDRRIENNREFVTFYVGEQLIGLPVNLVQEVIPEHSVTKIPRATADVRGLMNLRGQIVTVVNLRMKLGLELSPRSTNMNIIINFAGELLSLEVDSVGDVLPFSKELLLQTPATLKGVWRETCQAVVQLEKGLLVILDIDKVFVDFKNKSRRGE